MLGRKFRKLDKLFSHLTESVKQNRMMMRALNKDERGKVEVGFKHEFAAYRFTQMNKQSDCEINRLNERISRIE